MKKRHNSGSNMEYSSGGSGSEEDNGDTMGTIHQSQESSQDSPFANPQITSWSSRYPNEQTPTIPDITSSFKKELTTTTVMPNSITSSTTHSNTPVREMLTSTQSSESRDPRLTTPTLVLLVTFPSFLIAIVVLFLVIWFLWKKPRRRLSNRVQQPSDLEVKDKGDDQLKSYVKGQPVAITYYSGPDKQRDSTLKDDVRPAVVYQYEEVKDDQILITNQSSNIVNSSLKNGSQEDETVPENVNPSYHVLEPERQIGLKDAMMSHQNACYDNLDRIDKIDLEFTSGMKYDHVNPTSHEEGYDLLNRQPATAPRGVSNHHVVNSNEYAHMNKSIPSASSSYDKLNCKPRCQLDEIGVVNSANYGVLKLS